ncbi:nuclease-related domain-containing protein [Motilimonas sp. 1_MG-2023]|uniref:nuclease-related domain-containing protein n=1 Tax=Motilimonas TaxID=1914248 RepID=UPI0026E3E366|nr:NERD domain-containing protein [Motilimonas sp. 1_MG-2023]MDO6525739.1 NERD domain-containing protein [Motilimonas sp. 1_MG-2023]
MTPNPVDLMTLVVYQVWYVLPVLIFILVLKSRWFKGRLGEFIVNRMLATLPKAHYTLVKDVTLATVDGSTQIDHILVSSFGVFVIETKNITGWIFGSAKQRQWTQQIYRHKNQFQNPLHQNYKHLKTLQAILNLPDHAIHSLVIFIGNSQFKTPMPANVTYARGGLRYIKSFSDRVLTQAQVRDIVALISTHQLSKGLKTNHVHNQHVNSLKAKPQVSKPSVTNQPCPKCGSPMLIRKAKRGNQIGNQFWGCSQFPTCRSTLKY